MASFSGTSGNDIFTGGPDADTASGAGGNDSLSGADGSDILAGGAGSDTVNGGAGDDTLFSGDRSPTYNLPYYGNPYALPVLDTGSEVDTLVGGDGVDRFFVGYGDNVDGGANGYAGDYLFISFMGAPSGVTADFRLASQTIGGGVITGIENISYVQGSQFGDNIYAGSGYSGGYSDFTAVSGMGGNDTLTAGYYTGSMFGDDGDDVVDGRNSGYLSLVSGGAGNDTLYSSSGFSTAEGGAGNDTIYAYGTTRGGTGNDTIVMQSTYYSAQIFGDEGDDNITAAVYYSSWGSNPIYGGAGADTLTGSSGADSLFTGDPLSSNSTSGSDPAYDFGLERDRISAGDGADTLAAGYGDDVDGGAGTDTLRLSLGGATQGVQFDTAGLISGAPFAFGGGVIQNVERLHHLRGSEYGDTLTIRTQDVRLTVDAGGGDDVISSQMSSVDVLGGSGDDRFVSGAAADTFDGGGGFDTADYSSAASAVTVELGNNSGGGGDSLMNVEAVLGSAFADTLAGHAADTSLSGGDGDDVITDSGGSNYLRGNEGNDRMWGGSGFDDMHGNTGDDTLQGGLGDDWVVGGKDNDALRGDDGSDIVWGNLGNDTLDGGAGLDLVRGGQGDDVLNGGAGGDFLSGDRGDDTVTGGAGADFFHMFSDAGVDRVLDFNAAEGDRVMLDPGTVHSITQVGADVVIDMVGIGHKMILEDVQLSGLPAGWLFESWVVPW